MDTSEEKEEIIWLCFVFLFFSVGFNDPKSCTALKAKDIHMQIWPVDFWQVTFFFLDFFFFSGVVFVVLSIEAIDGVLIEGTKRAELA